jgi:hypothetical protein
MSDGLPLPPEIVLEVMSLLDLWSLVALGRCSKDLNDLSKEAKRIFRRNYPAKSDINPYIMEVDSTRNPAFMFDRGIAIIYNIAVWQYRPSAAAPYGKLTASKYKVPAATLKFMRSLWRHAIANDSPEIIAALTRFDPTPSRMSTHLQMVMECIFDQPTGDIPFKMYYFALNNANQCKAVLAKIDKKTEDKATYLEDVALACAIKFSVRTNYFTIESATLQYLCTTYCCRKLFHQPLGYRASDVTDLSYPIHFSIYHYVLTTTIKPDDARVLLVATIKDVLAHLKYTSPALLSPLNELFVLWYLYIGDEKAVAALTAYHTIPEVLKNTELTPPWCVPYPATATVAKYSAQMTAMAADITTLRDIEREFNEIPEHFTFSMLTGLEP